MNRLVAALARRHSFKRLKSDAVSIIALGAVVSAAATATTFFSTESYLLGLLQEFQLQYFFLLALGTAVSALTRRYVILMLSVIGLVFAGARTVPYFVPISAVHIETPTRGLRLFVGNVRTENVRRAETVSTVRELKPDVAVFVETDSHWIAALNDLRDILPYSHPVPRDDNFGLVVYSRFPLYETKILTGLNFTTPTAMVAFQLDGRSVSLFAAHPLPPASARLAELRDLQLTAISGTVREQPGPCILMGDLNTTPWSSVGEQFLLTSQLAEARKGFGALATWPSFLGPLGIPLDHILLSPHFTAMRASRVAIPGSDHSGLFALLQFSDTK